MRFQVLLWSSDKLYLSLFVFIFSESKKYPVAKTKFTYILYILFTEVASFQLFSFGTIFGENSILRKKTKNIYIYVYNWTEDLNKQFTEEEKWTGNKYIK